MTSGDGEGRHIKAVGRGAPASLQNREQVRRLLETLVERLEMQALAPVSIVEVEERIHRLGRVPFEDEGGVTGFVLLSTSHCAVHTWPLRSRYVLDVYSCRSFETAAVEQTIAEFFGSDCIRLTDLSHALDCAGLEAAMMKEPSVSPGSMARATE